MSHNETILQEAAKNEGVNVTREINPDRWHFTSGDNYTALHPRRLATMNEQQIRTFVKLFALDSVTY